MGNDVWNCLPRIPIANPAGALNDDPDSLVGAVTFALGDHVVASVYGGVDQPALEKIL